MDQKIIDRVALLIDSVYPDYSFCDVEQTQGVEPPRFFITCYRDSVTPRIETAGFFYTCNFDLVFDPGIEEPETLCNEVRFTLLPLLLKIPKEDGTNYRSDNVHSEFDSEQGVLHIFFDVTTTLHETRTEELPDIERLEKNTIVEVV